MSNNELEKIKEINNASIVPLEGKVEFDIKALPKIKSIFSKYNNHVDFIKNASLKEKMIIAKYLNTGKYDQDVEDFSKLDDKTVRNFGNMLLVDYVGIDTRGIIRIDLGVGANIDLFKVEERINKNLNIYLNPQYQGYKMKSGQVYRVLNNYYKNSKSNNEQNKAIHAYYDDLKDNGKIDYKRKKKKVMKKSKTNNSQIRAIR